MIYKDFSYKKSRDLKKWVVFFPGGYRVLKSIDEFPDESSIEAFIDSIIEFMGSKSS